MKLDIELDQCARDYGRVHRAGCRDLSDPDALGDAFNLTQINPLVEALTGWDRSGDDPYVAPCVKLPRFTGQTD